MINYESDDNENVKLHREITAKMSDTYKEKNADYGNSFKKTRDEFGAMTICIRLTDKLERLKSILKSGKQNVLSENIKDTLLDLATYATMELVEIQLEEREEKGAKVCGARKD